MILSELGILGRASISVHCCFAQAESRKNEVKLVISRLKYLLCRTSLHLARDFQNVRDFFYYLAEPGARKNCAPLHRRFSLRVETVGHCIAVWRQLFSYMCNAFGAASMPRTCRMHVFHQRAFKCSNQRLVMPRVSGDGLRFTRGHQKCATCPSPTGS